MIRSSTAARATPPPLRVVQPGPARHGVTSRLEDGIVQRLVEACVLLVAVVSGAVALVSNLVVLLRG